MTEKGGKKRKEKERKDQTFVHILTSRTTTSCKTHSDMVWQETRKKLIALRFFDRLRNLALVNHENS